MALSSANSEPSELYAAPLSETVDLEARLLCAGWSVVTSADEAIYRTRIEEHPVAQSYENSWGYLFQQARVKAFKYLSPLVLVTAIIKTPESPFVFLLPPIGDDLAIRSALPDIARKVVAASGKRVVLRKLNVEQQDHFSAIGFRRIEPQSFAFAQDYPEDVFPQVVLKTDIFKDVQSGSQYVKMRNHLSFLSRNHRASCGRFSDWLPDDLRRVILSWAENHNARIRGTSKELSGNADPSAYLCLIEEFASRVDGFQFFGQTTVIDDKLAGLMFAGRSGPTSAALYIGLCIQGTRGASEFQILNFLAMLSEAKISTLNLGGAETESLFAYKAKYGAFCLIPMADVEFVDHDLTR